MQAPIAAGPAERKHIPDYLLITDQGPKAVDVKPASRLCKPEVASTFAWTRAVVERRGWIYEVWSEPNQVQFQNVRFLAGFRAATERDSDRYLNSGLAPVECRHCRAIVEVKKLGPGYTSVQWNSASLNQCAYFTTEREAGNASSRNRGCPNPAKSIRHAVAEGHLEEASSAPPPGDGID